MEEALVPSIPIPAHTGRPRADDRRIPSNGICMYVLLSGCRWMDMICLQSMAPSKQFGNDIRSEVEYQRRMDKINIMNSLISRGYTSGLIINIDDLSEIVTL